MRIEIFFIVVAAALLRGTSLSAQDHVHPAVPLGARAATHIRLERVRLATGVEVEVAQAGPLDGTPVLFLHGFTDSWFSYSRVLDRLPPGIRAVVPSQRGHGDSERPACCYHLSDFAADAAALLDALGIERADVIGHSMGSFVAQRFAIDYPERVGRLVLVGSGATSATPPVMQLMDQIESFGDAIPLDFVREFQEGMLTVQLPTPFIEEVIAESRKLPAHVWRDALGGMISGDPSGELARIAAPTLVVWGDEDAVFGRTDQDELVNAIDDARLVVYEGTGHSPTWERPERFVEDIRAFLERRVAEREGQAVVRPQYATR